MNGLSRILSQVDEEIMAAVVAVNADGGATPLLRAAMNEVWCKSRRTIGGFKRSGYCLKTERAKEMEVATQITMAFANSLKGLNGTTRNALEKAFHSVSQLNRMVA